MTGYFTYLLNRMSSHMPSHIDLSLFIFENTIVYAL